MMEERRKKRLDYNRRLTESFMIHQPRKPATGLF